MTAHLPPEPVRAGHVAWVAARLSTRDWHIVEAVHRLRLVTGWQLDRLYFAELAGRSRTVSRSRALSRLVSWQVLARLPRRVGGAQRGSSVAVYALGVAGQRVLRERASGTPLSKPVRPATVPGDRFIAHTLAIAELYVQLVEADRAGQLRLWEFKANASAWWPNGEGGWLKPDAYLVTSNGRVDHLWWAEVDRATESVPTVTTKLQTYLRFVQQGQIGPREAIPRVLITVPHEQRRTALTNVVQRLPPPAAELFHVVTHEQAVAWLTTILPS